MARVVRKAGPGRAILDAALASIQGKVGRVGWFSSSHYPDGTPVAYIASIHEYGYAPKNIPPRLGLRALTVEKRPEWATKMETLAGQVFKGKMTGDGMLTAIGAVAAADIQKHISDVTEPALKASTLRNRASRLHIGVDELTDTGKKPLVEPVMKGGGSGGYLLATVQSAVGPKGGDEE